MDAIYARGSATAAEIVADLSDPDADASIRKLVRILEGKGWLTHSARGVEHVYRPRVSKQRARRLALLHVVKTFFDGAPERAAIALLDAATDRISAKRRAELIALIDAAAKDGR